MAGGSGYEFYKSAGNAIHKTLNLVQVAFRKRVDCWANEWRSGSNQNQYTWQIADTLSIRRAATSITHSQLAHAPTLANQEYPVGVVILF